MNKIFLLSTMIFLFSDIVASADSSFPFLRRIRARGGNLIAAFDAVDKLEAGLDEEKQAILNDKENSKILSTLAKPGLESLCCGAVVKLKQTHLPALRAITLDLTPDNKYMLCGSYDRDAKLYNIEDLEKVKESSVLTGHNESVTNVAIDNKGDLALTGSFDRTAILWNIQDRRNPKVLATINGNEAPISAVAFSPNSKYVIAANHDKILKLFDIANVSDPKFLGQVYASGRVKEHAKSITSIAFDPSSNNFMVGSYKNDNNAYLFNIENLKVNTILMGHAKQVTCCDISKDGKLAITGSKDNIAILWAIENNGEVIKQISKLEEHKIDGISAVKFSPNTKYVVTSGKDYTVIIWNIENPEKPIVFNSFAFIKEIRSLNFTNDNKHLLLADTDGNVVCVDLEFTPWIFNDLNPDQLRLIINLLKLKSNDSNDEGDHLRHYKNLLELTKNNAFEELPQKTKAYILNYLRKIEARKIINRFTPLNNDVSGLTCSYISDIDPEQISFDDSSFAQNFRPSRDMFSFDAPIDYAYIHSQAEQNYDNDGSSSTSTF